MTKRALLVAGGVVAAALGAATQESSWTFRVHPSLPAYEVYLEEGTSPPELHIAKPVQRYELRRGPGPDDGMEPRPVHGHDFVQALAPDGGIEQLLPMVNRGSERWLETRDVNFDGYQDLLLLAEYSEERDATRRFVWTYNQRTGTFTYQRELSAENNLAVDQRTRTLHTYYSDAYGSPVFERKTWRWVGGRAQCTQRERQSWDERRHCYLYVMEEWRAGAWARSKRTCRIEPHR